MSKIKSLPIDEHTEIFMGSDHAGLILEVEKEQSLDAEEDESIYIPMNAKYLLDEALQDKTGYEGRSINNKTIFLQEVLRCAGMKAFGTDEKDVRKQINVKTTPYMRKLKVKWKFLERATKRLASAKATKKAAGIMWTLEEEESLSKNYKPYKIFLKNTVEKVWRVR